jgi:transposase
MRKSRLAWLIQRRLIEHFVSGSTARTAASLVGVNKSTAAFYFHRLRQIIAMESEDASPLFGEIEVDESYFGGHRKGKRGRGAGGKIPVFGLLKRASRDKREVNLHVLNTLRYMHGGGGHAMTAATRSSEISSGGPIPAGV